MSPDTQFEKEKNNNPYFVNLPKCTCMRACNVYVGFPVHDTTFFFFFVCFLSILMESTDLLVKIPITSPPALEHPLREGEGSGNYRSGSSQAVSLTRAEDLDAPSQSASLFAVEYTEEAERVGVSLIEEEERRCYFKAFRSIIALLHVRQFEGDDPFSLLQDASGWYKGQTAPLAIPSDEAQRRHILASPVRDGNSADKLSSFFRRPLSTEHSRKLDFNEEPPHDNVERSPPPPLVSSSFASRWVPGSTDTSTAVPTSRFIPRYALSGEKRLEHNSQETYSSISRDWSRSSATLFHRFAMEGAQVVRQELTSDSVDRKDNDYLNFQQQQSHTGPQTSPAHMEGPSFGMGYYSRVLRATISAIFTMQPDTDCPYPIAEADCIVALGQRPVRRLADVERWERGLDSAQRLDQFVTLVRNGKKFVVHISS